MNRIPKAGWIALAFVLFFVVGAFLVGPAPDKGPLTSVEALAESEAETMAVTDPVHGRPFDVSVWSPTPDLENGELVLISHGFAGNRTSHADLAQSLVAQGYTVAAPTHPDLAGLESDDPSLDPLTLRPRHLSLTIDALEDGAGTSFESVSVIGHSLGGYSALRLAGLQPNLDGTLDRHCEETDDHILCSARARARFETLAARNDDFSDDRVAHAVLLAPGYGPLFGQETLLPRADVLVVAAGDDTELPGDQVDDLVNRLGAGAESSTVDGGHFVFLRPCTDSEAADLPTICDDPEGIDRVAMHADLGTRVATFVEA